MSDLAAIAVALPAVDLAPVAPLADGSRAIVDQQVAAVSVGHAGEGTPQPAELLPGFFALLHELAGESTGQLAPTEASRRQPEDPTERDGDEDPNRAATLTTPVWLMESPVPSIELPPLEPVSRHACADVPVEAVSLAADVAPGQAPLAAEQPLPASTAHNQAEPVPIAEPDASLRIEAPPGIRVSEEPRNAAAGRTALAFGIAIEPQVEPPTPGRVEPATAAGPVEASLRSEAGRQAASAALKEKPVAADQARNQPVSPDEPQVVETGHSAARLRDRHPDAEGSQAGASQRGSEPAVRMRDPEAADPHQAVDREPRAASEALSPSHAPTGAHLLSGDGPETHRSGKAEAPPPPPEPAVAAPRRPEPSTREISLRVEGEPGSGRARAPVAVHVVERAGRIEIRVRSADPQLSQWLCREVPALMDRLEAEGYRSQILAAAPEPGAMTSELPRFVDPQAWMSPEGEGSRHGGAHPDSQQHRPRPNGHAPEDEAGPGEMSAFRRLHDGFLG